MTENEKKTNKVDYEDDFVNDVQGFEYRKMLEKADNIVLGFVAGATATCAVPIPIADAAMLVTEQVAMMAAINGVFHIDVTKDGLTSLAAAAIGAGGATVIGKTIVTSVMKFIPGVGTLVGGVISAGTAGVITLALGKAYIQVCKAIKMGKLNQSVLTKKAGRDLLKKEFREQLKKQKDKGANQA